MRYYSDTCPSTTLSQSITNTDLTTLVLVTPVHSNFSGFPFCLRIDPNTANEELIVVISGAGTVGTPYVYRRAFGTTTAKAHAAGAVVTHAVGMRDLTDGHPIGDTTTATVANTVTETVLSSITIPAGYSTPGTMVRLVGWGLVSNTGGPPTLQLRSRLGGVAGTLLGDTTTSPATIAVTSIPWRVEVEIVCITDGASSTWQTFMTFNGLVYSSTVPARYFNPATSGSIDSTVAKDLVITAQWGTTASGNTISCKIGRAHV